MTPQSNKSSHKQRKKPINQQINVRGCLRMWIIILKFATSYRKHDFSEDWNSDYKHFVT